MVPHGIIIWHVALVHLTETNKLCWLNRKSNCLEVCYIFGKKYHSGLGGLPDLIFFKTKLVLFGEH